MMAPKAWSFEDLSIKSIVYLPPAYRKALREAQYNAAVKEIGNASNETASREGTARMTRSIPIDEGPPREAKKSKEKKKKTESEKKKKKEKKKKEKTKKKKKRKTRDRDDNNEEERSIIQHDHNIEFETSPKPERKKQDKQYRRRKTERSDDDLSFNSSHYAKPSAIRNDDDLSFNSSHYAKPSAIRNEDSSRQRNKKIKFQPNAADKHRRAKGKARAMDEDRTISDTSSEQALSKVLAESAKLLMESTKILNEFTDSTKRKSKRTELKSKKQSALYNISETDEMEVKSKKNKVRGKYTDTAGSEREGGERNKEKDHEKAKRVKYEKKKTKKEKKKREKKNSTKTKSSVEDAPKIKRGIFKETSFRLSKRSSRTIGSASKNGADNGSLSNHDSLDLSNWKDFSNKKKASTRDDDDSSLESILISPIRTSVKSRPRSTSIRDKPYSWWDTRSYSFSTLPSED